jgi:hypothetical protein
VAEHWDGTAWTLSTITNVPADSVSLTGVRAVASNDVWAVGYQLTGDLIKTLVEHWNGSSWSVVSSPNVGADDNSLGAVTAVSANDVWAVGWYRTSGGQVQTLTEHWNGGQWSVVSSPTGGQGTGVLSAVGATAGNEVWAVGLTEDAVRSTLALRWTGSSWQAVSTPNPSSSFNGLRGVVGLGSGDAWAVGSHFDAVAGSYQTLAEHWDGTAWTVAPTPAGEARELVAVAKSAPSKLWGTGWSDRNGNIVMEQACPIQVLDGAFSPKTIRTTQGFGAAWSIPGSDAQSHSVTDGTGMGLFDSGLRPPGSSFFFVYVGAGTYSVTDTATGHTGSVEVPTLADPPSGTQTTTFTITWSSAAAPAGYQFDVQIKRPTSSRWVQWMHGQAGTSAPFVPDFGTGTYRFRARMRQVANGKASGWSPAALIQVNT